MVCAMASEELTMPVTTPMESFLSGLAFSPVKSSHFLEQNSLEIQDGTKMLNGTQAKVHSLFSSLGQ